MKWYEVDIHVLIWKYIHDISLNETGDLQNGGNRGIILVGKKKGGGGIYKCDGITL